MSACCDDVWGVPSSGAFYMVELDRSTFDRSHRVCKASLSVHAIRIDESLPSKKHDSFRVSVWMLHCRLRQSLC